MDKNMQICAYMYLFMGKGKASLNAGPESRRICTYGQEYIHAYILCIHLTTAGISDLHFS